MIMPAQDYPSDEVLEQGLSALLCGSRRRGVTVVSRQPNALASTHPSEIVRCRLPDGRQLELFCKYKGERDEAEGRAYRYIVEPSGLETARLVGNLAQTDGRSWLVLEFLGGSRWLSEDENQEQGLREAATWIGRFHAYAEERVLAGELDFLPEVDRVSTGTRLGRLWKRVPSIRAKAPWLPLALSRFEEVIRLLLEAPTTVVHGDYYPVNIMRRNGIVFPIDWEHAALGPGELDLATLTDGWPRSTAEKCEARYIGGRYGSHVPVDFDRRLAAARAYMHVRWLGEPPDPDRPERTRRTSGEWRLEHLRQAFEKLELLPSCPTGSDLLLEAPKRLRLPVSRRPGRRVDFT